jgi:hypothetical protein
MADADGRKPLGRANPGREPLLAGGEGANLAEAQDGKSAAPSGATNTEPRIEAVMDDQEQRRILIELVRDPDTAARERVSALRLLREIDEANPSRDDGDAEVRSMEAFMATRRKTPS